MTKNNKDSATKNKGDEVVEVDGAKGGAMPKNVAVEVSKDEADQIEKIKRTLKSKKGNATRFTKQLKERIDKFKAATDNCNNDSTRTRTALKLAANQLIETRDKLVKNQAELETLAEEISNVLIECSVTEAEEKLLTDVNQVNDSIDETLSEYVDTISDAIDVSKEVTPQRNSAAPASITQQGETFRDVPSLNSY